MNRKNKLCCIYARGYFTVKKKKKSDQSSQKTPWMISSAITETESQTQSEKTINYMIPSLCYSEKVEVQGQ